MKKFLSLLLVLTCLVGIANAKNAELNVSVSQITKVKSMSFESRKLTVQNPTMYLFPTTCGFGSFVSPTELTGQQWVTIWAGFQALCWAPADPE
jgi:hypothetical protein